MTKIETAALRALAEAATPGPWIGAGPSFGAPLPAYLNEVVTDYPNADEDSETIVMTDDCADDQNTANIDYIAAANPTAVLALLDELDRFHAENAAQAQQIAQDRADAARYQFLRDGEWRDTDLEPTIRLQLNVLWDAKIDAFMKGKIP